MDVLLCILVLGLSIVWLGLPVKWVHLSKSLTHSVCKAETGFVAKHSHLNENATGVANAISVDCR